ncbi:hypothetical protein ACFXKR_13415 [Streptomyces violascens]|uniref:hypothetical protein n=1 Tax=Streptomyces violascens TaxID=67381 RepID=UPI00369AE9F2
MYDQKISRAAVPTALQPSGRNGSKRPASTRFRPRNDTPTSTAPISATIHVCIRPESRRQRALSAHEANSSTAARAPAHLGDRPWYAVT